MPSFSAYLPLSSSWFDGVQGIGAAIVVIIVRQRKQDPYKGLENASKVEDSYFLMCVHSRVSWLADGQ